MSIENRFHFDFFTHVILVQFFLFAWSAVLCLLPTIHQYIVGALLAMSSVWNFLCRPLRSIKSTVLLFRRDFMRYSCRFRNQLTQPCCIYLYYFQKHFAEPSSVNYFAQAFPCTSPPGLFLYTVLLGLPPYAFLKDPFECAKVQRRLNWEILQWLIPSDILPQSSPGARVWKP